MVQLFEKIKETMNGDKVSKSCFLGACFSVMIFTLFITFSIIFTEKPMMEGAFAVPKIYSENIIYFPCSGELFAQSLAKYIHDNELEICGMASKNTLWTKGYIVGVRKDRKGKILEIYKLLEDAKIINRCN